MGRNGKRVRSRARQDGFQVADPAALPAGITAVKGEWAGVRMSRGDDGASAGPTGVAWVNSNGWAIRLAASLHPSDAIWVLAPPPEKSVPLANSYLITLADSASHGGRWVIELDPKLCDGLKAKTPAALATWKKLCDAAGFFAAHKGWAQFEPQATVGVISDFAGEHEFFGGELLNLLARAGQHYRILLKDKVIGIVVRRLACHHLCRFRRRSAGTARADPHFRAGRRNADHALEMGRRGDRRRWPPKIIRVSRCTRLERGGSRWPRMPMPTRTCGPTIRRC